MNEMICFCFKYIDILPGLIQCAEPTVLCLVDTPSSSSAETPKSASLAIPSEDNNKLAALIS